MQQKSGIKQLHDTVLALLGTQSKESKTAYTETPEHTLQYSSQELRYRISLGSDR